MKGNVENVTVLPWAKYPRATILFFLSGFALTETRSCRRRPSWNESQHVVNRLNRSGQDVRKSHDSVAGLLSKTFSRNQDP
jgi:hypothetical protein